ncbi:hypothetical protein ACFQJC_15240 [Haloferax namakaokahaiae]|uniref:Uncharacterized protein n=1 Tax=Haloferax namakaokahaiae TaxID=1748331 RepID=A0ABD5ZHU0_9EURY
MLLVVTYSKAARTTLRNIARTHDETVVRRFGRAALFDATELGAFLALRLQEKHDHDVQILETELFNEFESVPEPVRTAAAEYESRETASTPYSKFAVGTDHPSVAEMRTREL